MGAVGSMGSGVADPSDTLGGSIFWDPPDPSSETSKTNREHCKFHVFRPKLKISPITYVTANMYYKYAKYIYSNTRFHINKSDHNILPYKELSQTGA